MCTLSWEFDAAGYSVFFNRDELKTRRAALPIRIATAGSGSMRVIHPVDAEKGGSWIGVNEVGVTTCLLNLYACPTPPVPAGGYESRGSLVMALIDCRSWEETLARLSAVDPVRFPPFHLFQFDATLGVRSMRWTGTEVEWLHHPERCDRPASGSSFENEAVVARRKQAFRDLVVGGESKDRLAKLEQFHQHTVPDAGAYGVNMRRPDAQTMSISRIDVAPEIIRFRYADRGVDQIEFGEAVVLTLPRTVISNL